MSRKWSSVVLKQAGSEGVKVLLQKCQPLHRDVQ
jgi:hypothetical protein